MLADEAQKTGFRGRSNEIKTVCPSKCSGESGRSPRLQTAPRGGGRFVRERGKSSGGGCSDEEKSVLKGGKRKWKKRRGAIYVLEKKGGSLKDKLKEKNRKSSSLRERKLTKKKKDCQLTAPKETSTNGGDNRKGKGSWRGAVKRRGQRRVREEKKCCPLSRGGGRRSREGKPGGSRATLSERGEVQGEGGHCRTGKKKKTGKKRFRTWGKGPA